jgi:ABC-type nitrate/sulfonate/bicarbonate transport system substrate-binding protein
VAGNVDYYIVDGNHFGCWSVMVAPDAPIQSAADLKGKTIEILPYAVEPFLLHGHMWLHHWLKAPGLDAPQEITLTTLPWEALPSLNDYVAEGFKTGKFDAVAVGEPRPSLLEDKHIARRLVTLGFDHQLDVAQALERAFETRIESGAIKTDKTPQELVRLYYRKLE